MVKLIFRDNKTTGYSTASYYSSSVKNEKVKEKGNQELNDILGPIIEESETWHDKYRYLSLDESGKIYLDMKRYEEEKDKVEEEQQNDVPLQ